MSKPLKYAGIGVLFVGVLAITFLVKDEIQKGIKDAKREEQKRKLEEREKIANKRNSKNNGNDYDLN